jgi:RES domain-containing protein
MILYRFTSEKYSTDVSGEGAKRFGGRWNSKGIPVLYTSAAISLSLLELLVHSASYDELKSKRLVTIETPEKLLENLPSNKLKKKWQTDIGYCRFIGDSFLLEKKSLLMKIPSAIIPEEYNVLINPLHSDFKKISVKSAKVFEFDARLF